MVPSESASSLGGRILGESRSSLTGEMLEALVCAKDRLFKEKGVSNEGIPLFPYSIFDVLHILIVI
jgi:hypothetical protein